MGLAKRVRELVGDDGKDLVEFLCDCVSGRLRDGTEVPLRERIEASKVLRSYGRRPLFEEIPEE